MNFKLKPVETIVAKIIRDFGLGDKEVSYQDYIEWIYEGLQHIGAYTQYTENLMTPIEIVNYRGKLPDDYFSMMANPHLKYRISHDTITTELKNGTIKINYLSLPVDTRGYPLVPDNVSYDEALKWKVAMNLATRGEITLPLELCEARWLKYVRQARAQGNAFSADQLERMRDIRHKLVPDIHQYDVDFKRVDGRFKEDTPDGRN